jgi:hypothetical protein
MMQAVRGIYRGGVVELLEQPPEVGDVEVVVTFLTNGTAALGDLAADAGDVAEALDLAEDAPPLDDFEPIVPTRPFRLSDLVLEDRR